MISVPSRRQPLSGSNILLLFFLPLALSLSACDLFTKVQPGKDPRKDKDILDPIQGRRVFDPETGTYVIINTAPTAKMDTVIWKEVPMSTYPPITSEGVFFEPGGTGVSEPVATDPNTGSKLLESYNVVIALPFQTDRYTAGGQIPANSSWALNFYSGSKIALDELKAQGLRLNVSVVDTKATEAGMSDLIRRNADLANAHLIIGPYRKETVRLAADFAKQKGSVLVSPYFSGENLTDNNPNYIQVNPSIQTHCEAILENARKNYRPDQIVLVCRGRDVELERLKYFQDAHKQMQMTSFSRDTSALREFVIADEGDAGNFRINVQPLIQNKDTLAIIVPSWSSESFINALLQQLSTALAGYSEFTVYGMPQWIEYERIDYALYKNLRLHLTASHHVDRDQWPVQDFQRNYFLRFGAIPAEESYLGYDVTLYFCQMLKKYGTRFQYSLREDAGQGLHTRFEVRGLPVTGSSNREIPLFRQFENKYLNILQFQDFRFVKIN
jgi:hypothetical protein